MFYLPWEVSHAIIVIVYIPPSAAVVSASDVIHSVIAGLEIQHPSGLVIISGEFSHISFSPVLKNFKQYVNCATKEKIEDVIEAYVNVKGI